MMSLFIYLLQLVVGVVITLALVIYFAFKYRFQHWKKKNIPHLEPSFPMGNFSGLFRTRSIFDTYKDIYEKAKHHKLFGFWAFFNPHLLINNPELIKNILVRDFDHFTDRGAYLDTENDPLNAHLVTLDGVAWRNLRVKLAPTFTSGKLKMMYGTMVETADELVDYLSPQAASKSIIDIKEMTSRFTTEVIASVAFGIKAGAIQNSDAIFRVMGQKIFKMSTLDGLKMFMNFASPSLAKYFKFKIIPLDIEKFFMGSVKETVDYRKENNVKRNDFLQLLIQLMDKGYIEDVDVKRGRTEEEHVTKFSFEDAVAQAFVFFVAGLETSAATIELVLYELAKNPDMQQKLQNEIDQTVAQSDGKLSYEGLSSMKYLERVVNETLRLYSPGPVLIRKCVKDYKVPDSEITIEKGSVVHIPVVGIHSDPSHFPNPEKFDPDRFLPEEVVKRHHYTYLPFGDGPRICIGNRFALMQSKAGVSFLLRHFNFEVCEKTPIPFVQNPKAMGPAPVGGTFLRIVKRR